MRRCDLAYVTALRLAKGEGNGIEYETLNKLCQYFEVGVEQILEYTPDEAEALKKD
jgi:DNA-binding Xre family transcriptional regulator